MKFRICVAVIGPPSAALSAAALWIKAALAATRASVVSSFKIWFGKKTFVPLNSNLRNYYMIRNSIKLILYEKMDISWRIYIFKRSITYIILSLIIFKFSFARIKMILFAIKDGFFNIGGKIKN